MFGDVAKGTAAVIGAAALVLVVSLIIGAMYLFGFGWFSKSTANFRGGVAQTNRVLADPDYRIAHYDGFYDLCASVQVREDAIAAIEEEMKGASPERRQQLAPSLTANRIGRANAIRQYNADARKEDTAANFLASDLPYQLDPTEERTTCTV